MNNRLTEPTPLSTAYVDVHGACRYTSLSRRTLDYARAEGELPFIKKGKKVLFAVRDLDKWIQRDRIDVTNTVQRLEGGQPNE